MITIDQKTLHNLHRLWRDRSKTLHQAALLLPGGVTADKIRQIADAYGQCAEELDEPPFHVFSALGYDSENAEVSHGDRERQPDANQTHNQP